MSGESNEGNQVLPTNETEIQGKVARPRNRQRNKIPRDANDSRGPTRSRAKPDKNDAKRPAKASRASSKTKSGDDVAASAKFLQISKLIKKFKPATFNYLAINVITDKIKAKEDDDSEYFKSQYRNSDRMSAVQKHIAEYIKNQPLEMIYISFVLKPSDPDFPFDLESLKLTLSIPGDYPINKRLRPSITILNQEIPRGFAANIELGYKRIAEIAMTKSSDEEIELVDGSGLKSQFQTLDKYLELFLKQEKRQTIKFIKNVKKKTDNSRESSVEVSRDSSREPNDSKEKSEARESRVQSARISRETLDDRSKNVESMRNKLKNRVKLFKRSTLEERYKIELPIYNQHEAPALWKLNRGIEIMTSIPMNYPHDPISISFPNNYNTNLILKFKSDEDRKVLLELTKDYRRIEKNLTNNVNNYKFENDNLVMILNWICNNIEYFAMDSEDFQDWNSIRKEVAA